ncbi:MAG: M20 aminoacylase family protein [Rhizobiaceae bacterium]
MPSQDILAEDAKSWRRNLHQHPELLFDLPRTAAFVEGKLREFGCDEIASGIATSGVVGVIKGKAGPGPTIMLRSDMDALPIAEQTNLPHASKTPDRMHACGHDGHMAMLLAAARHLAESRDFAGTVVAVFQPAEEGGAGARFMIEEGLLERFGIDEVYGMHNKPGLKVGSFATRPGTLMAAGDRFVVMLTGRGGHAAAPHLARDPVLAASQLVGALQAIASRYTDPFDPVVVSITYLGAGNPAALNVIPASAQIGGTIRTIAPATRKAVEERFRSMVRATAQLCEMEASIDWRPGYPAAVNDAAMVKEIAAAATRAAAGDIDTDCPCVMGSEDFAYMLEKRPGAIVWLGNGDTPDLHHPSYDFNDTALPYGIRYWLELVKQRLPAGS